ncbi:TPA: hypothetical protein ACH3X1_014500 [Trebouxia sp. C0004]
MRLSRGAQMCSFCSSCFVAPSLRPSEGLSPAIAHGQAAHHLQDIILQRTPERRQHLRGHWSCANRYVQTLNGIGMQSEENCRACGCCQWANL